MLCSSDGGDVTGVSRPVSASCRQWNMSQQQRSARCHASGFARCAAAYQLEWPLTRRLPSTCNAFASSFPACLKRCSGMANAAKAERQAPLSMWQVGVSALVSAASTCLDQPLLIQNLWVCSLDPASGQLVACAPERRRIVLNAPGALQHICRDRCPSRPVS